MAKAPPDLGRPIARSVVRPSHSSAAATAKADPPTTASTACNHYSPRMSVCLLSTCVILFIVFNIQNLRIPPSSLPSTAAVESLSIRWQKLVNSTAACLGKPDDHGDEEGDRVIEDKVQLEDLTERLRQSVTFLPLKDLRYADKPLDGHTWFMSSMYDAHEDGEYQQFPSGSSLGRVLCLKGRDNHDGSWNSYGLAWPDALPNNATYMPGLTFVSYNHYDYGNIWHGLSAVLPFVAWHQMNGCQPGPDRWVLYHWGEIRAKMGPWLTNVTQATFDRPPSIEVFDGVEDAESAPVCFEKAVVMRHNEGGMSSQRRMEAYDLVRCKARAHCGLGPARDAGSGPGGMDIGLTVFMRTGPRSFRNETAVVGIFQRECAKVEGCRLMVAHSNNLTFCEQVKLMSLTDILVSPHGAQLTNMFLMDRNSSVMEFFPKGWLRLAGVGQYVYHWIASWSGMRHMGAWRDPDGDHCPYPDEDRRCMNIYKSGLIGYNETHFAIWARTTLAQVKARKTYEALQKNNVVGSSSGQCTCRPME
ncbi:hypothetical protein SAY86_005904 [Trapa natans]|uniref:Glycosyltransferase 61 catalytic domain-containing protein n=1 Tax=Trapa natans TaxID=22666 RepID=A0AAN7L9U0_TRANT|nr:hypothetical protein SAY86_005904 [Trapa natans]